MGINVLKKDYQPRVDNKDDGEFVANKTYYLQVNSTIVIY